MTHRIVLPLAPDAPASAPDFAAVYREYQGFVGRTLRHLGVDPGRVDDAVQDTFLVVHRRLGEFAGRAALRTWLFEIARRVASRYRRTAAREAPRSCPLDELSGSSQVDEGVAQAEAAEMLRVFLGELDRDKSVVFILSELEQWRAPEIAEALELNVNTVYARLRAARKQLDRVVARMQARERRPRVRRGSEIVAAAIFAVPPPGLGPGVITMPVAAVAAGKLGIFGVATSTGVWATGLALAVVILATTSRPDPGATPTTPTPTRSVSIAPEVESTQEDIPTSAAPTTPAIPELTASAPTRRARRASGPSTASDAPGPFAAELALLESARAALLADDANTALERLARHRQRFPDGSLAQEAAATKIAALCRLADADAARRELEAFTRRWPGAVTHGSIEDPCRP